MPFVTGKSLLRQGAGNYNAMCMQCHLAPGMQGTELSRGLYPPPPDLTRETVDAAGAFWVIKHGIKASGMPAWGRSMGDEYIWNMTAFVQQLPGWMPRSTRPWSIAVMATITAVARPMPTITLKGRRTTTPCRTSLTATGAPLRRSPRRHPRSLRCPRRSVRTNHQRPARLRRSSIATRMGRVSCIRPPQKRLSLPLPTKATTATITNTDPPGEQT